MANEQADAAEAGGLQIKQSFNDPQPFLHKLHQGENRIGSAPGSDVLLETLAATNHAVVRVEGNRVTLINMGQEDINYYLMDGTGTLLAPRQTVDLQAYQKFYIANYTITYLTQSDIENLFSNKSSSAPLAPVAAAPFPASPAASEGLPDGKSPSLNEEKNLTPLPEAQNMPLPEAQSRAMAFLPSFFHENDFLRRYLLILESLWEPMETRQDFLPFYFDPRTCPAPFLPYLAHWLGLEIPEADGLPEANRRALLAFAFGNFPEPGGPNRTALTPISPDGVPQTENAAGHGRRAETFALYGWLRKRGTLSGLQDVLQIYAGRRVEVKNGAAWTIKITLFRQQEAAGFRFHQPNRPSTTISQMPTLDDAKLAVSDFRRIVERHKPAAMCYVLEIVE